jgi:hypothetical protein
MPTPKGPSKRRLDPRVLKIIQELGRIGGQTRARNLTAVRRREIAAQAARARWTKRPK